MGTAGKTVVITGAASGIGRYVAKTFARAGANIVVADIRTTDIVMAELQSLNAEAVSVVADITVEEDVRSLFDATYARFGRVDTLINNAGIAPHFSMGSPRWPRIRDTDRDHFAKVIETNLTGTFLCTKHAVPYMEALAGGHIVNFGQGTLQRTERRPNLGSCSYDVSKVAIRAFTRIVAEEEREFNICIVSMGPGSGTTRLPPSGDATLPGLWGGIVTEDSPPWARDPALGGTSVDQIGDNYVVAADAPMELSGSQVMVRGGSLVVVDD